MSDIEFVELRKIAENATPGEWQSSDGSHILESSGASVGQAWGANWRNNQTFIATFNPATVLELIDRLERAEAELGSLKGRDTDLDDLEELAEAQAEGYRIMSDSGLGFGHISRNYPLLAEAMHLWQCQSLNEQADTVLRLIERVRRAEQVCSIGKKARTK